MSEKTTAQPTNPWQALGLPDDMTPLRKLAVAYELADMAVEEATISGINRHTITWVVRWLRHEVEFDLDRWGEVLYTFNEQEFSESAKQMRSRVNTSR